MYDGVLQTYLYDILLGAHPFFLFIKNGDTAGHALCCKLIDVDVGTEGGMIP